MIWEFNDLRGCWAAFCCRPLTPGSPALAVTTVRFPAPLIPALNPVLFAFLCCSSFTSSPRLASVETAFHDLASRGRSSVPALHLPPWTGKMAPASFSIPHSLDLSGTRPGLSTRGRRAGCGAPRRFRAVAEGALLVSFQNVLTCHRIQALAGTALRGVLFLCCLPLPATLIQF